jgi:hypothetical protein
VETGSENLKNACLRCLPALLKAALLKADSLLKAAYLKPKMGLSIA